MTFSSSCRRRGHRAPRRAQRGQPRGLPAAHPGRRRPWPRARPPGLRQPRPRLRRRGRQRQAGAARTHQAQPGDRHQLQRHALRAPAVRRLPRGAQAGRDPGRRHRPGRRRGAGDVRRHHPGPRRHAALALQPRRDRHVDRDRAQPRHVRRRADARRVRQDRARAADRGAVVRPPADRLRAGRADGVGPAQRREGAGPPALRRGQGRARGAARGRGGVVPLEGHVHVLRHGQLQPAADGGARAAPARLVVRQPRHAAARGADPGGGASGRSRSPARAASPRRSASSSTRRRSSTPASRCSPAAARPTTRCTWSRSRGRPASPSPGTTCRTSRPRCRCWRGSTPTARPT